MIGLNLKTNNKAQERIKQYLEENVSQILADKINNGIKITKDNKILLNKKDLDGFWKFATDEARKQAEKGANGAYVDDETVFGWAIHYFEEDTIEGKLFNEDGTEYIKNIPNPALEIKENIQPKKENNQASLFDLMSVESQVDTKDIPTQTTKTKIQLSAETKQILRDVFDEEIEDEEETEENIIDTSNQRVNVVTGEILESNNAIKILSSLFGEKLKIQLGD